jgi:hypothetical protein
VTRITRRRSPQVRALSAEEIGGANAFQRREDVRGSSQTTNRFRALGLAAAAAGAVAAAFGCASPPPTDLGPPYQEQVARWTGENEADLVTSWGMPQKTHVLADGGRVIEYRYSEDQSSCTTRFTLDRNGKVVRSWYTGVRCAVPKSG